MLYGATRRGGATNEGAAFRISLAGDFTVLHSFTGEDVFPNRLLLRTTDGDIYGTLEGIGGFDHLGSALFRLTPQGAVTILRPRSRVRIALVQGPDGLLYGTDGNELFRMTPAGEVVSVLQYLVDVGFEGDPGGALVAGREGNFYLAGIERTSVGAYSRSILLRVTPSGGVTVLHTFAADIAMGSLIEGSDGHLYGTSHGSGSGADTVFRVTKAGTYTSLHQFTYFEGQFPSPLMQAEDGPCMGRRSPAGRAGEGRCSK